MFREVDRKHRLPRIWSNRQLKTISPIFKGKIINVSAGENIDKEGSTYDKYFTTAEEFWVSNYAPGYYRGYEGRINELLIDLTKEIPEEYELQFDVVFNHTTIEHIFEVFTAFSNICKLSKDIVILVAPFAQVMHEKNEGYNDYWRFTPTCLRMLFNRNDFEVVYETVSPYKNAAVYLFFVASRHPDKWQGVMPEYEKLADIGLWIGEARKSIFNRLNLFVKRLIKKTG